MSSIGEKASEIICKSGFTITYLYDLYTRSSRGDPAAVFEIARRIRVQPELEFVFYAFSSAAKRNADAKRRVTKVKAKSKKAAAADSRNGSWGRLTIGVRASPKSAVRGGLPSLGKRSR
jgi:hypothetical protein